MADQRPVGIFDSGVGGLTVVKEFVRLLPQENVVYFGDTARVPYGPKSQETVIRFSIENILLLLRHRVKLIIIACNTASSVALSTVGENFRIPVLGVIQPGAQAAAAATRNRRIGVIGTRTTVKSRAYEEAIRRIAPGASVFSASCPLFVPLVEEGWLDTPVTVQIAADYLQPLRAEQIDTLVLGCTHYPLLKPVLQRVLGAEVVLVDSAQQVSLQAQAILEQECLLNDRAHPGQLQFFVSDEPDNFAAVGRQFLGFELGKVEKAGYV
ncbi:MAG: glutamate racemase [Candidatus Omnitrophica bacterium]|nr:glutamate racemase [Candidatus Omnitrophota bacterium]